MFHAMQVNKHIEVFDEAALLRQTFQMPVKWDVDQNKPDKREGNDQVLLIRPMYTHLARSKNECSHRG